MVFDPTETKLVEGDPALTDVRQMRSQSLRTKQIPNTYSYEYSHHLMSWAAQNNDPYYQENPLRPCGHLLFHTDGIGAWSYGHIVYRDTNNRLFEMNEKGDLEYLVSADSGPGTVTMACPHTNGYWILFYGTGPQDVYTYSSIADASSTANAVASKTGIYGPRVGYDVITVEDESNNNEWIWGTYNDDTDTNKIWKISAGGTITEVENESGTLSDDRHLQSGDADPYNVGNLYITAGDADNDVHWYKSTDYGDTWSELANVSGSQKWRTLGLAFDENYIYWGSDGLVNGSSRLYRAARGSVDSPTELAVLDDDMVCYGVTMLYGDPHGLVLWQRPKDGTVTRDIPVYFYDLDTGTLKQLTAIPGDNSAQSNTAGWEAAPKYRSQPDHRLHAGFIGYARGPYGPRYASLPGRVQKLIHR